jgi:hypothetical protein
LARKPGCSIRRATACCWCCPDGWARLARIPPPGTHGQAIHPDGGGPAGPADCRSRCTLQAQPMPPNESSSGAPACKRSGSCLSRRGDPSRRHEAFFMNSVCRR